MKDKIITIFKKHKYTIISVKIVLLLWIFIFFVNFDRNHAPFIDNDSWDIPITLQSESSDDINIDTIESLTWGISDTNVPEEQIEVVDEIEKEPVFWNMVVWANFDFVSKKIPSDSKKIELYFFTWIDPKSINDNNFTISPDLDWEISVEWNKLIYSFEKVLKEWNYYDINIWRDIKSIDWTYINSSYDYTIEVVKNAKISLISPTWQLRNLNQSILVFFDIPQVPLTTIEEWKLPCPIEFHPKVDWNCIWTTTSVLEFIPEQSFYWASNYDLKVSYKEWMFHRFESKKDSIETPRLKITNLSSYNNSFNVLSWVIVNYNFPVKYDSLVSKFKLTDSEWKQLSGSLKKIDELWSRYFFELDNEVYYYWKKYFLTIDSWVEPLNWNVPTDQVSKYKLVWNSYVSNSSTYRQLYSTWWELIDTIQYGEIKRYLTGSDLWLNIWKFNNKIVIDFQKDIELNKKYFKFYGVNWKIYDLGMKYWTWKNDDWENITYEHKLIVTIPWDLNPWEDYFFEISKDIDKHLEKTLAFKFTVPEPVRLVDFVNIDYSKSCLYFSNEVSIQYNSWYINFQPDWIIRSMSNNDYIPWNFKWKTWDEYIAEWYCPPTVLWKNLIKVDSRLNWNSTYDLVLSWSIEDIYWNKMWDNVVKKIKTWNLHDRDRYLYSSLASDYVVYPKSENIVINLQSINNDNAYIDVCQTDINWYIDYLEKWRNYDFPFYPKCTKKAQKYLKLKNYWWDLSNNIYDLEEDVVGWDMNSDFVIIRWNTKNDFWFEKEYWKNITNMYIRSNLALNYNEAENYSLLYVTNFSWQNVQEEFKFTFYKRNWYPYKYDLVTIDVEETDDPWLYKINNNDFDVMIVKSENYFWLVNKDYDYTSNYDLNIYWWNLSYASNFLYLYTDRPIYKPWDRVYLKWLLREFNYYWFKKWSFENWTLVLKKWWYEEISTHNVTFDENSNFTWYIDLPKDIWLWEYKFSLRFSNNNEVWTNSSFFIEEYVPPVFKVNLDIDKTDIVYWDDVNVTVDPDYYFWWNVINTDWKYSIFTQNYFFDAKDYSNYQFGEWYWYFSCIYWWDCSYSDNFIDNKEFEIWDDGIYKFSKIIKQQDKDDLSEKIFNINFTVNDPNTWKSVSSNVQTVVHNTDWYVWIDVPYFMWEDSSEIKWVVLDRDAQPMSWKDVQISTISRDWKKVKKQWVDWIFYSYYTYVDKLEASEIVKSNDKWEFEIKLNPEKWWEYIIEAIYTWSNNKSFKSSSYAYVPSNDFISWRIDNNDATELITDNIILNVWDKQSYTLQSPVNTWSVLFTIEKDDWILDYFVEDLNSYWYNFEVEVKDNYYPNFYLRAYLIWFSEGNPLPIYKRAASVTKVNTEYKKLNVEITTDKEVYKPKDKISIKVTVKDLDWNPVPNVNWSISVVDQSVLALKWNPKKNPYAYFYDMKRYLSTTAYVSLVNLIKRLEVKDNSDWQKWWDWENTKWWDSDKKRWEFKDTAYWLSNFKTNEEWIFEITTDSLPDNLTTWEIEALVNEPEKNLVWVNQTTVITQKQLMISDNLPRVLFNWDEVIFYPIIFNKTSNNLDIDVNMSWTNLDFDESKIEYNIGQSEQVWLQFKAKVNLKEFKENASSKITISVKSKDWEYSDTIEKYLPIYLSSTKESVATFGKTKDNKASEILNFGSSWAVFWQVDIKLSPSLFIWFLESVDHFNHYPYNSLTSRIHSMVSNIYIKSLYESVWEEFDLKDKFIDVRWWQYFWYIKRSVHEQINLTMLTITSYQKPDWWFVYYSDPRYKSRYNSNFYLTTSVLKSLWELKKYWYKIDESAEEEAINFLKRKFYENKIDSCTKSVYNDCTYSWYDRLKAVEALLSISPNDYEAYKMYQNIYKQEDSVWFKILLAKVSILLTRFDSVPSSLLDTTIENINLVLADELVFNPRWAYVWSMNRGNRLRNSANLLSVLWLIWEKDINSYDMIVENLIRRIMSQKDWKLFWSYSDTFIVLENIRDYLNTTDELKDVDVKWNVLINSDQIWEFVFTNKNKFSYTWFNVLVDTLPSSNEIIITEDSELTIYYDMYLEYSKLWYEIPPLDYWFKVNITYYDYNEYKKIESNKVEEWSKYLNWDINYSELIYPKNVIEYMEPVQDWKVWQLLIAHYNIINSEKRDWVWFESFIPTWSELVNTNLNTEENVKLSRSSGLNFNFDIEEYRNDRFFWYIKSLNPWNHSWYYVLRLTHEWDFNINPTRVFESDNQEVFWRNWSKDIIIKGRY